MAFTLTSSSFANGQRIAARYTCDADEISPDLAWSGAPDGTHSFALIMHDPDAPKGDFTHWLLYDIAAAVEGIPEGAAGAAPAIAGCNDFGKVGYGGPCPPPGHGAHRYIIELYAVDVEQLGLPQGVRRAEVERALEGHTLAKAQIVGQYERQKSG